MTVFLGEVYTPQKKLNKSTLIFTYSLRFLLKLRICRFKCCAYVTYLFKYNPLSILLYEGVSCKVVVLGKISLNQ